MDFALLPPEINSARMYAGPGSGPMLAAAAAWDGLAAELGSAATSYQSVVSGLTGQWRGPSSMAMSTAAAPYVAWMNTTAAQAEQAATQAKAAAAAYETAFAMTVPPPVVAANRKLLASLVATNFLGQNTLAIAVTEAHYGEMWAQDAAAMYGYAGSSAAATTMAPFSPPKRNTNPGGLGSQTATVMQTAGTRAQSTVSQLLQGLSQPLQATSSTTGLGQTAMSTGMPVLSSVGSAPASALTGLTATSGKGALAGTAKSASLGAGVLSGLTANPGSTGLALDALGLGADTVGLGGLEIPGLGTEFLGLGTEFYGLDLELLGAEAEGVLGPGGVLGGGFGGGLGLLGGLAGTGGVGVANALSATADMGQAASLGSLSVPSAWTAAAPAMRQVALMSSESNAAAASAAAAGASEIPYAEMALAGMAGRAMAGTARWGHRERTAATTRERPMPPQNSLSRPVAGIVAKLRDLLAELRDAGILTEEELTRQKKDLFGG